MAYVGLGKLSKKFPKLFLRKIVFIQSLFDSLEKVSLLAWHYYNNLG